MRWFTSLLLVLALHFGWEMMQARWFVNMHGMPPLRATFWCFRAALGDVVITAIAFSVAALTARSAAWPARQRVLVPAAVFVAAALPIVIGYELFAISTGRWQYDPSMPTIFGIGALPLLQWLLLPIVEVWIFRLLFRRLSE